MFFKGFKSTPRAVAEITQNSDHGAAGSQIPAAEAQGSGATVAEASGGFKVAGWDRRRLPPMTHDSVPPPSENTIT